jgi:hypothetical protein
MAGFALLMKARADDRRLFDEPVKLNVLSFQESKGLDADELALALQTIFSNIESQVAVNLSSNPRGDFDLFPDTLLQGALAQPIAARNVGEVTRWVINTLITTFSNAKTIGSLIQIPKELSDRLMAMVEPLMVPNGKR